MGKSKIWKRVLPLIIALIIVLLSIPISAQAASHMAYPYPIKFTVDGTSFTARTFTIDDSETIFVKVRDIANALKKTDKKFSVTNDSNKKILTIKPGKSYTAVGGEHISNPFGPLTCTSEMTLYKNNTKQKAKVYTIDKENYVALSTLAKISNFSMKCEVESFKCTINTDYDYGKGPAPKEIETSIKPASTSQNEGLLKEPFPHAALVNVPKTIEDYKNMIIYLAVNNKLTYTFETNVDYSVMSKEGSIYKNLLEATYEMGCQESFFGKANPEIFYGVIGEANISLKETSKGSDITIKFEGLFGETGKELEKKNKEYFSKTKAVVQNLINDGVITSSMTDYEKARALCFWIAENVEYDDEASLDDTSNTANTGYGAIVNKKAVCSGYTSLYNLMCRYVGLYEVEGMVGSDRMTGVRHMWTLQVLDGTKVMTDATWCDSNDHEYQEFKYTYFAESADFFVKSHVWDEEIYSKWNSAPGLAEITRAIAEEEELEEDAETAADDKAFEEAEEAANE